MVEARELVTVCRQIGGMLEAGVDILRVTLVVRAQTHNPRLLEAFAEIEHSLRIGASVSEALEGVPDVFSPFAVSLVQEGEAKRDIAGAFLRIADFLQQEEEAAPIFAQRPNSVISGGNVVTVGANLALPSETAQQLIERAQVTLLRGFSLLTVWLLALTGIWGGVESGFIGRRWQNVALCGVSALFSAGAVLWLQRQRNNSRVTAREPQESEERASAVSNANVAADVAAEHPTSRGAVMPPRNTSLPSVGAVAATLNGTAESSGKLPRASSRLAAHNGSSKVLGEEGQNGSTPNAPTSGTPLATSDALAAARQVARRKYGAMADAADVMNVQPDIYEMDDAETMNADELLERGLNPPTPLPPSPHKSDANGTKPTRDEADFD